MKVALLAPMWHVEPDPDASPTESVTALAAELQRLGVEVQIYGAGGRGLVRLEPADRCEPWWEALHLARSLGECSEVDLVHNLAGLPSLAFAGYSQPPLLSSIQQLPEGAREHAYRAHAATVHYLCSFETTRSPELDYVGELPLALAPERQAFDPRGGAPLLVLEPLAGQLRDVLAAARASERPLLLTAGADSELLARECAEELASGQVQLLDQLPPELPGAAHAVLALGRDDAQTQYRLLRAMAAGTPVLAPHGAVLDRLVADGQSGLLLETTAQFAERVDAVQGIDRKGCRQWVRERFGAAPVAQRAQQIYRRLHADCAPRARQGRPPWGEWTVLLDEPAYKVKRIRVNPGRRLSYQRHTRRSEHWLVVEGHGRVTLDGKQHDLHAGQAIDVPAGVAHRIANPGPGMLSFVEVQTGDYFGEDDIERLEDDYGRAG